MTMQPAAPIDIDDCTEAIGKAFDVDDLGNVVEHCAKSPVGQHQYSIADKHERCIHCGERSGL